MATTQALHQAITQLRHDIKIRKIKVTAVEDLSSVFRKFTFQSEDLKDFVSKSPDDHVKVFFPAPQTGHYTIPTLGEQGLEWDKTQPEPIMRDYTPYTFNPQTQTLELLFFLRPSGAGALWAQKAKVGDEIYIAGPRGSFVVDYIFDWYLIFTDESGLPSLTRRLQEMPKDAQGMVFIEVEEKNKVFDIPSTSIPKGMEITWLEKKSTPRNAGHPEGFLRALENFKRPEGQGFVWIKTESYTALQLKNKVIQNKITEPEWIKASGYWKR